jgi:MerR family transcriptional regulator, redox-sensitive transcriptional activator SoxR
MKLMTIGEVAKQSGLNASAIRYYENAGVLPKPVRTAGQRRYDVSVLERLAVLERAKQCGFTLDEARQLFHGFRPGTPPSERWQVLARKKIAELDELASRIEEMKVLLRKSCACSDLAECGRRLRAKSEPRR